MRIGIDARLNAYRRGGIPEYTRRLLEALARHASRDHQFVVFQHREHLRPLVVAPQVARRTLFTPSHHRWEQTALALELLLTRLDVLHCPDFIAPLRRRCAAVVTIHDLAFLHFPEILDADARRYYGQVRTSVQHTEGVIAVSEATRTDIAQLLELDPARVTVIHEAADPAFVPLDLREDQTRRINDVPLHAGEFALVVGTLEPRKNLPMLLQSLRIALDRNPQRGYRLVLVGSRGWRDEPIFRAIEDLGLAEHVLLLGTVAQDDLCWLYNACVMYLCPSIYEGFGLPLLEALACGTPALASDVSSLPEIAGDAALLLPPRDPQAWADALTALWDDLPQQQQLAARGLQRAAQFSWTRAAQQTMAVYRRAMQQREQGSLAPPRAAQPAIPVPVTPAVPAAAPEQAAAAPVSQQLIEVPVTPATPDSATAPESVNETPDCPVCGIMLRPAEMIAPLELHVAQESARAEENLPAWSCEQCGHVQFTLRTTPAVALPGVHGLSETGEPASDVRD